MVIELLFVLERHFGIRSRRLLDNGDGGAVVHLNNHQPSSYCIYVGVTIFAAQYDAVGDLVKDLEASAFGIRSDIHHEVNTSDHRNTFFDGVTNIEVFVKWFDFLPLLVQ